MCLFYSALVLVVHDCIAVQQNYKSYVGSCQSQENLRSREKRLLKYLQNPRRRETRHQTCTLRPRWERRNFRHSRLFSSTVSGRLTQKSFAPPPDSTGRTMTKVVPSPGALSTKILPQCASTMRLQMDSPKPIPFALVVNKGVQRFCNAA